MIDINKIEKDARKQIQKEQHDKATGLLTSKLRELAAAKVVVTNIERELEALKSELAAGI